jgi:hypothetical protein
MWPGGNVNSLRPENVGTVAWEKAADEKQDAWGKPPSTDARGKTSQVKQDGWGEKDDEKQDDWGETSIAINQLGQEETSSTLGANTDQIGFAWSVVATRPLMQISSRKVISVSG